jgi:hypothetical protein
LPGRPGGGAFDWRGGLSYPGPTGSPFAGAGNVVARTRLHRGQIAPVKEFVVDVVSASVSGQKEIFVARDVSEQVPCVQKARTVDSHIRRVAPRRDSVEIVPGHWFLRDLRGNGGLLTSLSLGYEREHGATLVDRDVISPISVCLPNEDALPASELRAAKVSDRFSHVGLPDDPAFSREARSRWSILHRFRWERRIVRCKPWSAASLGSSQDMKVAQSKRHLLLVANIAANPAQGTAHRSWSKPSL